MFNPDDRRRRPSHQEHSRNLAALEAMALALHAEIVAFRRARRCLPWTRQCELFDSLSAVLSEQQKSWNDLSPELRGPIDQARARMISALQGIDPPSVASRPGPITIHPRSPKRRTEGKWS